MDEGDPPRQQQELVDLPIPDPETVIWRYLSFTKFADMLDRGELWFARADTLPDEHEGSLPTQANYQNPGAAHDMRWFREVTGRYIYVNCWSEGPDESVAMWNLYADIDAGVAIRSTVGNLMASSGLDLRKRSAVARVQYLDYAGSGKAEWTAEELPNWFFAKRRSYRYEDEIRAGVWDGPSMFSYWGDDPRTNTLPDTAIGVRVSVDLSRLVDAVRVAPRSRDWYLELVQRAVDRAGLARTVERSDLDRDPVR